MIAIRIETPTPERLAELGVEHWPEWAHEAATFPWTYGERETCFVLAGRVTVTPEGGEPVNFGAGER